VTEVRAAVEERTDAPFDEFARQVDDAVSAVEQLEPAARAAALELKAAIEAFHRPALVQIVRRLRADPRGKELLFELADDPSVRAVLALQGIIRPPVEARVATALEGVRPYLQSHGGDVEVVAVTDGVVRVRLHGACNGCSMSAVTLREGVEGALVGIVDGVTAVEVVEDEPTPAFIPLGSITRRGGAGWVEGPPAGTVPPGGMVRFDVGDDSFVITNVENRLAVFRNECVHQGMTLDGGWIDDGVLVCPWHGFRYDASSGECLSAPGAQLPQVPLRIDDGRVWIRAR
jgi:Fe-S cluster biogenesis protein NfuA/nitrite reductase/ring-hydroxylating ferredoxin subunit